MSRQSFFALFEKRRKQALAVQPDLRVTLTIGAAKDFPKVRDYAYSAWDGQTAAIVFAPKTLRAPLARQDALIRHELSHALMQTAELEHSERECDALAEKVFGDHLYYDAACIQTLDQEKGVYAIRPRHLPQ